MMASSETFLEYGISVTDAHFAVKGHYHLRLTLEFMPEAPNHGYEGISVQRLNEEPTYEHVTYTDSVEQKIPLREGLPSKLVKFEHGNATFRIPKEYVVPADVTEDAGRQAVLLVEAVREELDRQVVLGKGVVNIFPHPRANCSVPSGIPWYMTNDVLVLARLLEEDGLPVTCGRVRCSSRLSQARPCHQVDVRPAARVSEQISESPEIDKILPPPADIKPILTPEPPPVEPYTWPEPTPLWPPADVDVPPDRREWQRPLEESLELHLETPAPELPDIKVDAMPLPADQEAADWWECPVSSRGTETVTVNVYAAANLPPLPGGKQPTPFVILGVSVEGAEGPSTSVTRSSIQPCCNPTWHEALSVTIPEGTVKDQELVLSVADSESRQLLVSYQIPVTFLQTFHHYHLNLVTAVKGHSGGVHLYVSILRTGHTLPEVTACYGLEVLLHGTLKPLKPPCRPLLAVARIEEDLGGYQESVGEDLSRASGVTMVMVTFPSPHPSWFQIPEAEGYGVPQVSLLGRPADQPQWDHTFLFVSPADTYIMSSSSVAALVIEFYPLRAPKTTVWRIEGAVGFCSLLLSDHVLDQLRQAHRSNLSLRVPGLVLQGGILSTEDNKTPSVDLALRLIEKKEEPNGSVSHRSHLQQLSFSPPSLEVPLYKRNSQQICFSDIHLEVDLNAKGKPRPSQSGATLDGWMARSPHHGQLTADHLPPTRRAFKVSS